MDASELSSKPCDWRVKRAAACLAAGGVIVHATEAVFGIAACAALENACARVVALKRRPRSKPFIVLVGHLAQLDTLVTLDTPLLDAVLQSWPGPHTWILPAAPQCPPWLHDRDRRLAVRVTAHAQAALLCEHAGPLISTSANPPKAPPARNLLAARRYFGAAVDDYLPGKLGGARRPSSLRDATTGRILRA
jgi:L-threonylcarbamoyladenylate synthase